MASPEYQQQQKQQPQNERDSQGDLQHNQPQINMDETFSARTSFTADSPYYTSYVETEMRQVQVLSQTLQEISARAKTFGKCGALMAEATRRLALACRLKPSNPNNINNNNSNHNSNNNAYDDEDGKNGGDEDKVVKERQEAVGEEMMVVLSTLGEVCIIFVCLHVIVFCVFLAPLVLSFLIPSTPVKPFNSHFSLTHILGLG